MVCFGELRPTTYISISMSLYLTVIELFTRPAIKLGESIGEMFCTKLFQTLLKRQMRKPGQFFGEMFRPKISRVFLNTPRAAQLLFTGTSRWISRQIFRPRLQLA